MSQREDRPTGWFLAGYAGVAGFFIVERWPASAARPPASTPRVTIRARTSGIVTASVAAATLAPLLRRVPVRPLPRGAAPVGLGLQVTGLDLRIWSMRTLGASYSRTLRTKKPKVSSMTVRTG